MSPYKTAQYLAELGQQKKAQQILIMDISKLSSFADYFVIMSGQSNIQVKAIAEHIENEMRKQDIKPYHKEGYEYQRWIILDYIDVVVHIFKEETRQFYAIERLWADAEIEYVSEKEEV